MEQPEVNALDLVTSAEVAVMFGVSRQRVNQLMHTGGFAEPVYASKGFILWRCSDVEAWGREHGYVVDY